MSLGQLLLILLLIALNAFFVGVQFAVVASRRSRLDLLASPGSRSYDLVRRWLEDEAARDRLIAASQLGITLASLGLGAVGQNVFQGLVSPYLQGVQLASDPVTLGGLIAALPLVLSLVAVAGFYVVLGEQVPRAAALHAPERVAITTAPLMQFFIYLFSGFIQVLDWASRVIMSVLGISANPVPTNGHPHPSRVTLDELRRMVASPEVERGPDQPEREMLPAVIDFGNLVVRQVAIPRTEIIAVEAAAPVEEAIRLAADHGLTKLPVYEENLDQIAGILHIKDLMAGLLEDSELKHRPCRELAREALFVPESASVNHLLVHLRSRRQHMAITLDEFGGTAGLVTLEDLLEEIVGDVQDPFDQGPPPIQTLPDGTSIIDGMALIENVNDHFGLNLFDPNYDTIAGYMLGKLGRIAQVSDVVEDNENGIQLRVESMDRLRIARVRLSRLALAKAP